MSFEDDNKAKHELLDETKKLAEELLKNPEYAEKAIKDRNIIIRGLKADIEHRIVAFKEIVTRYDELADQVQNLKYENEKLGKFLNETNKNLIETEAKFIETNKSLIEVEKKLEIEEHYNDSVWVVKIEKATQSLQGWKGGIIRILFSRPVSQYVFLSLFCLLFVASFIGWTGIAALLAPIFHLIRGV